MTIFVLIFFSSAVADKNASLVPPTVVPTIAFTSKPKDPPNVWEVIVKEFSLNHEVNNPAVQRQLKWLMKHPGYLNNLVQAKPYIYHIINELRKRNMPGELALIPMIESEYDPFVSSSAGAAGLWQLMPGTSVEYAGPKDWWTDGRRSIGPSTDTALNYLNYLHRFFHGNWILAVAAYNSGEGKVQKAVKKTHQQRFWPLPLPMETKNYVPRLLALSEIIQNPKRYHVELPNIPHEPYFKEVNVMKRLDLNRAAKLAEIPKHDLMRLNPGLEWSPRTYRPYKLLIPTKNIGDFNRNLANLAKEEPVKTTLSKAPEKSSLYRVKKGDSLDRIARHNHLSLALLKQLNPGVTDRKLKPGQKIALQRGISV